MLADSEAMFVDAGTYLFNMLAERLKRRAFSESELQMTTEERHYTRRLHRLYLELVPPFISVATLLAVTATTLRDAIATMLTHKSESASNHDPDLQIMLLFSGLNLLLDMVNVTCFARADQAVLTPLNFQEMDHTHETSPLIGTETATETETNTAPDFDEVSEESSLINLNMCSAWTVSSYLQCVAGFDVVAPSRTVVLKLTHGSSQHVFADTLRSVAVLVAAGIASMSDMISAEAADSVAAVIVSLIILFSCMPLTKGLVHTAVEIRHMHQHGISAFEEIAIAV
jgi:Co/Zn/Cd efflux system component